MALVPRVLFFILTLGFQRGFAEERFLFEFSEVHLGTEVKLSVYAWNQLHAEESCRAAFRRIAELESLLDDDGPGGELGRLRRAPPDTWVKISPELYEVLDQALQVAMASAGALDTSEIPSDQAPSNSIWSNLELRKEAREARTKRPGLSFDLSAMRMGFVGDQAILILQEKYIKAALVQAGEDVIALGAPPGQAGWRAEVRDSKGEVQGWTLLKDLALSRSGRVRVLAPGGLLADHLAEASSVMGIRKAKSVVPLFQGCRLWDPDRDEIDWWNRVSRSLPSARASVWGMALGISFLYSAMVFRRRRNLIRDLPMSRPRSVAMGMAEVVGKAASLGDPFLEPETGKPCVWYKKEVTRYAAKERGLADGNWREESRRPFRLVDGAGSILVEPAGARIYGKKTVDQTFDFNRVRVWTIEEGEEVYILGEAVPSGQAGPSRMEKVGRLLKFWSGTPELREKLDLNKDGILQPEEWDRARAHAEEHVSHENLAKAGGGQETILRAPRRGYFLISTRGEKHAMALQGRPWLWAILGLAFAAGALRAWPPEFTEILVHRPLRGLAEAWPILMVVAYSHLHTRGVFQRLSRGGFAEYHG